MLGVRTIFITEWEELKVLVGWEGLGFVYCLCVLSAQQPYPFLKTISNSQDNLEKSLKQLSQNSSVTTNCIEIKWLKQKYHVNVDNG